MDFFQSIYFVVTLSILVAAFIGVKATLCILLIMFVVQIAKTLFSCGKRP